MELKVILWNSDEAPTEELLHNQLMKQDLRVYHWSSQPESVFDSHTHAYHKVLYVVKGNIKFDFPTRHKSFNLNPGDRLDLPAGIRHSAVAGLEGADCLEAHIY